MVSVAVADGNVPVKSGGNGGVAPIKAEYIITKPSSGRVRETFDDDAAEQKTNPAHKGNGHAHTGTEFTVAEQGGNEESQAKQQKLSGAARKRLRREQMAEERKRNRGMNTNRKFTRVRDDNLICNFVARMQHCPHGAEKCKFSHSLNDYLTTKPKDIRFPSPPTSSKFGRLQELAPDAQQAYLDRYYSNEAPFVKLNNDETFGSVDVGTICPIVLAQQASSSSSSVKEPFCYAGWTCRFLGGHVKKSSEPSASNSLGWELMGTLADENEREGRKNAPDEQNWADPTLPNTLKKHKYPLYLSKAVLEQLEDEKKREAPASGRIKIDVESAKRRFLANQVKGLDADDMDEMMNQESLLRNGRVQEAEHSFNPTDVARIRPGEKRRLDWFHDELYLAPLTTTGNLPFRRLCVGFGADITCGEMGLADSYLHGNKNEWSLVRRWAGERCFGTQVCGSRPDLLVPTAEVLAREFPTGLDFIDVNCGCPIDLVFTKGAGSALLDHHVRLGRIVRGMNAVSGEIPITVKLRTGTSSTQTTHRLFPKLKVDWDVGAATLHGRSRQQRYKHSADWQYIKQCTQAFRESITAYNEDRADEEWHHPVPIYGNGDVYSWQDYEANKALTGVDGQMLARGALIKPWLFTEIKEKRDWDISSRERLDIIRQLCSYGVTHWGSDSMGVNQTRRFICEALSFMHRYIPIGLLERLPVHLHDRPPPFVGRNELETLLASPNANDWVRITEMFLGKAPEQWSFTPKHKSNAYGTDNAGEDQG